MKAKRSFETLGSNYWRYERAQTTLYTALLVILLVKGKIGGGGGGGRGGGMETTGTISQIEIIENSLLYVS